MNPLTEEEMAAFAALGGDPWQAQMNPMWARSMMQVQQALPGWQQLAMQGGGDPNLEPLANVREEEAQVPEDVQDAQDEIMNIGRNGRQGVGVPRPRPRPPADDDGGGFAWPPGVIPMQGGIPGILGGIGAMYAGINAMLADRWNRNQDASTALSQADWNNQTQRQAIGAQQDVQNRRTAALNNLFSGLTGALKPGGGLNLSGLNLGGAGTVPPGGLVGGAAPTIGFSATNGPQAGGNQAGQPPQPGQQNVQALLRGIIGRAAPNAIG